MFSRKSETKNSNQPDSEEYVIDGEWKLIKKIGAGSFGEIFTAVNKKTREYVAVKMEIIRQNQSQLKSEYQLLRLLSNNEGITKLFWYGKDTEQGLYNCLIMELLGPSLEDLHAYCKGKFSLKTTLMIADQMLKRIKTLHDNYLIHRDIKPDNFVMGTGNKFNLVYVIDFGLSKFYMDPKSKQHIPFKDFRSLTGTARYCSINTHSGYEQSRRDDLEALVYVWIYLAKGSLPWQGLPAESKKEKFAKISKAKMSVKPDMLCSGLPEEFIKILNYSRSLNFEEEPKYKFVRSLLHKVMERKNYKYDCEYDWIPTKKK